MTNTTHPQFETAIAAVMNEFSTTFRADLGFDVQAPGTDAERQVASLLREHTVGAHGLRILLESLATESHMSAERYAYRIADATISAVGTQVRYFHYNDCSATPLRAATHWFWQTGNRWVAVAGEDATEWFEGLVDDQEVINTFLVRPIEKVPTMGTILHWDADANEVERPAA